MPLRRPLLVLTELHSQMPTGIRVLVETGLRVAGLMLALLLAVLADGRDEERRGLFTQSLNCASRQGKSVGDAMV